MSDTPRFHKGNLGPLSFSDLNKAMDAIASVKPLIEMLGGAPEPDKVNLPNIMIVFATRDQITSSKYAWREIILHNDEVLIGADDDYEKVEPTQQVRHGEAHDIYGTPLDTYAISLDLAFDMGYAICFAVMQADGGKRYVLAPLKTGMAGEQDTRSFLAKVVTVTPHMLPMATPDKPGWLSSRLTVKPYYFDYDGEGGLRLRSETGGDHVEAWDLGIQHPSFPNVPPGTTLDVTRIEVNTIVAVHTAKVFGTNDDVFFISKYPRFDVFCG